MLRTARCLALVAVVLLVAPSSCPCWLSPPGGPAAALAAEPAAWKEVSVPEDWRKAPSGKDGWLWYRTKVAVPEHWRGEKVTLVVEAIDDARSYYAGGQFVGTLGVMPPNYRSGLGETERFDVPGEALLYGGETLLAIRVCNIAGRSGFNVAAPVLFAGDEAIRLAGKWETAAGDNLDWRIDPATGGADAAPPVKTPALGKVESRGVVERELKKLPMGDEGPLAPHQTLAKITTPADLAVDLVLAEPVIGQPLSMKWDARGRLWLVEYLQYPEPAGLVAISRDKHLRTVYDRVPPAPPNHFPGKDRISIHEDTDGDGVYDKHSRFVEGLSLVTSFEFGRGGVWVLNPPYLLFYPDADGDDVPDGDPEVHLEGFGIEDSHSITNNLRWGPDGWLYATQGSTVTADVRRPGDKQPPVHSMGQLVWRYHPEQRKYEIFAEGGGNAFGLEIDAAGRIYSGHNGGNTRGFHYVQGGYYQKGFGKHGELSNPYAFGYFEAMGHHQVPRFTHAFVIYEADALPPQYRGRLFGVGPLQSHVVMSEIEPDRSSFKTRDVGFALESADTWVRPVDIQVGPDGAIYVADFYEQRIDHASHYQGRTHRESGRIYRIRGKEAPPASAKFDLAKEKPQQLVARLKHENKWFRQAARRELMLRHPKASRFSAALSVRDAQGQEALELLWTLAAAGELLDDDALVLLDHREPQVRLWAVRLACDDGEASEELARELAELAYREVSVHVRSQLASSARRLPAAQALPIVKNLIQRSEDADDIHIPLLVWWAIEAKADADREAVLAMFADKGLWEQPLARKHLIERLMRRYASTGQRKDLLTAARLFELAPSKEHAGQLMAGFEAAYEGRSIANLPVELAAAMTRAGAASPTLRLRQGDADAVAEALATIGDERQDAAKRQQLAAIFGTLRQPSCVPVLLRVVRESRNDTLRSTSLAALQSYNDPAIGTTVLSLYGNLPDQVREVAQSLLASRRSWAEGLISAIDAGQIDKTTILEPTLRKLLLHDSPAIAAGVKRHFGELAGPSAEELRLAVEKLEGVVGAASGNPYAGRELFAASCGKCHVLFGHGAQVGPDLTAYKRDDLRGMLLSVVHPSAEIREGFENYVVRTIDGRTLTGYIADQDANVVVIRGADGQSLSIARDEIEDMRASSQSLMPEGLLKDLTDQQVRDLFAYLRASQPLPE